MLLNYTIKKIGQTGGRKKIKKKKRSRTPNPRSKTPFQIAKTSVFPNI